MDNRLFEEKDWNYYTTVIPIMLFVIIFLLWAAFTKIDETIKGTGKVVPSGQTKVIQNLEGGIVSAILLNEGDSVKKGDTIYNLSNAFFSADSITKEIDLLTFQAILIRLDALIENKTVVDFPEELKQKIPEIVENETKIFYEDLENFFYKVANIFSNVKFPKGLIDKLASEIAENGYSQPSRMMLSKLEKNKISSDWNIIE